MAAEMDTTLRGPKAYAVARAAIDMLEEVKVWPTALNFELWLHLVADPKGPLALEIQRLLNLGESITDIVSEDLAKTFLPKAQLTDQIRDTGDMLTQELATVSRAIEAAQKSSADYGQQLEGASRDLNHELDEGGLKHIVKGLTQATSQVQSENRQLEQRLAES